MGLGSDSALTYCISVCHNDVLQSTRWTKRKFLPPADPLMLMVLSVQELEKESYDKMKWISNAKTKVLTSFSSSGIRFSLQLLTKKEKKK